MSGSPRIIALISELNIFSLFLSLASPCFQMPAVFFGLIYLSSLISFMILMFGV